MSILENNSWLLDYKGMGDALRILNSNSSGSNTSPDLCKDQIEGMLEEFGPSSSSLGQLIFAYVTPGLIGVALITNLLSVIVFRKMSKERANRQGSTCFCCLMAISGVDILVLIFHVFFEWDNKGLTFIIVASRYVSFIENPFVCYLHLLMSYSFRLAAVWMLVLFNVERYIAICMPLQKQGLCTKKKINSSIAIVILISFLVSSYKPILNFFDSSTCSTTSKSDTHRTISFYLDTTYALLMAIIPFIVILFLNLQIGRALVMRSKQLLTMSYQRIQNGSVNYQYAIMLVAISVCYLILNLPYTVVWMVHSLSTHCVKYFGVLKDTFYITKTIFYLNYCANFFLYNLTLLSFRHCFFRILFCRSTDHHNNNSVSLNRQKTNVEDL